MKVSIIIPVLNMEDKLDRCLTSVVNQTYKNIEIIVVDDGSTDSSLDIMKKYASSDPRIVIISRENKGISYSRNEALDKATGDYICFADSDDYVEPTMVEDLLKKVMDEEADICVCNYYLFDENNRKASTIRDDIFGKSIYDYPQMLKDIDYAPWNKIYKKELFDGIRFPLDTKYEDLETIIKVFTKANKIVFIKKPLYNYYINMSGETRLHTPKNMDMLKIAKNLSEFLDFNGKDKILKDMFFEVMSEKLLNSVVTLYKVVSIRKCLSYIDEVYKFLDDNCSYWKKLYKSNSFNSNKVKFIRGNKIILKMHSFIRMSIYKIFKR